ncbi:MAG TPA: hypothetical protein VIX59_20885 [Candidatus Binataceae bacterium]
MSDACPPSDTVAGGRADFDTNIRQLQDDSTRYHFPPLTKLSGVGDAAFLNTSGQDTAQVYLMKSGTYFRIELFCGPATCASWSAALARRVAARIKAK